MKEFIEEINEEYSLVESLLEKVSKSIFTIEKDTELIKHEIMELSTALENLGLSINELSESVL